MFGMVFLTLSSFSEDQFGENLRLQCVLVVILTGLFVANIFLRKNIISFLENICGRYFTKAMIECISFAMVSGLAFLIKYPRFNIHSPELTKSCILKDKEINQLYYIIQCRLYVFGAFSLLTLLISAQTQETAVRKVSSWLLGLTIEASMEIPGSDGPNLHYMFGTALFCIFLIFLKHYMDSQQESRGRNTSLVSVQEISKFLFKALVLFGIIYRIYVKIDLGPSSEFTWFIEFFFFYILGYIIFKEMEEGKEPFSDHQDKCKENASLNIVLLLISGILVIWNKDNRFHVQSKLKKICADEEKVKKLPHGSQFNLYSAAAFSLYTLVISLEKDQSMELGIFDFILQLTMDASIDLISVWYMVVASVYCTVLMFARIYLAPVKTRPNSNGGEQNDGGRSSSGTEGQEQLETRPQIDQGSLQRRHNPLLH